MEYLDVLDIKMAKVYNYVINISMDDYKKIIYTGPSMNPTLMSGGIVSIIPYFKKNPFVGDVILFKDAEGKRVIHRIIRVNSHGFYTQGDNNLRIDPGVLTKDDIKGKVTEDKINNRSRKIYGGFMGRTIGYYYRTKKQYFNLLIKLLHPIYHLIIKTNFFKKYFSIQKSLTIANFQRDNGIEYQLFYKRKPIGKLYPNSVTWQIKRPYKLFIDETLLPKMAV